MADILKKKLTELTELIKANITINDWLHINSGGVDYKTKAGNFIVNIVNNLTTSTAGSALDAAQGKILDAKVLNTIESDRCLFVYDSQWTVNNNDEDATAIDIEIPAGLIRLPNKSVITTSTFTGTIGNGNGLKLTFVPLSNVLSYSIVSNLDSYTEGNTINEYIICKNITGNLVTYNSSLYKYISGNTRNLFIKDKTTETLDGFSITQQDVNRGVVTSILALQRAYSNLAGAFVSLDLASTPISITTTELFIDIVQDIESTNTDIIEIDETNNYITIKHEGVYQISTYLDVQNDANQSHDLILRIRNNADNSLISERTLSISRYGYTGTSNPNPLEITSEMLPLVIKLSLDSDDNTSFTVNSLNTSMYLANAVNTSGYNMIEASSPLTATPTGNYRENEYYITALNNNITFANPSGTYSNGNTLMIRIEGRYGTKTITWGDKYGNLLESLPLSTVSASTMFICFIYNHTSLIWECCAVKYEVV